MKSIIVGAGTVGYSLAASLCAEGYDVTVIDSNRRPLEVIEAHLNTKVVLGNAAKLDTLREADIDQCDLMIAVTERDELNMVSCFMAKNAGAKSVVARVRTPGYSNFDNATQLKEMGVDLLINPDRVAAEEIEKLIRFPEANYVGYFGLGEVQMLELHLDESCAYLNVPMQEIDNPVPFIVVGVERDGELLIPRGRDYLQAGDDILLLTSKNDMSTMEDFLNIRHRRPKNVIIVGGSLTAYYLARMLEKDDRRLNVKLLDDDAARCAEMAAELSDTTIIHCASSYASVFEDENVDEAELFVAVTEDDKENLFTAALARHMGAGKTIIRLTGTDFLPLLEQVGVDKAVNPNSLTTDTILRFVNRSRILSLTRFDDTDGQITEYVVPATAPAVGKMLMELNFPKQAIICMIIREHEHIIPGGRDRIDAGDTLLVFSRPGAFRAVEKLFTAKGE